MPSRHLGLVAFDLDGTLLRGSTVCELIAEPLGRSAKMRRFEALAPEFAIVAAREEMARWYAGRTLAERLGVARSLGTGLEPDAAVRHVWPRDEARWLTKVAAELRVSAARVAAVGDSGSDADLLAAASLRFFVGEGPPPALPARAHRPGGDIVSLVREILDRWAP